VPMVGLIQGSGRGFSPSASILAFRTHTCRNSHGPTVEN
jgi:hypothetical protein